MRCHIFEACLGSEIQGNRCSGCGSLTPNSSFRLRIVKIKEFFELWRGVCFRPSLVKPWKSPFESDRSSFSDAEGDLRSNSSFFLDDSFMSNDATQALYARIRAELIKKYGAKRSGNAEISANHSKLSSFSLEMTQSLKVRIGDPVFLGCPRALIECGPAERRLHLSPAHLSPAYLSDLAGSGRAASGR